MFYTFHLILLWTSLYFIMGKYSLPLCMILSCSVHNVCHRNSVITILTAVSCSIRAVEVADMI